MVALAATLWIATGACVIVAIYVLGVGMVINPFSFAAETSTASEPFSDIFSHSLSTLGQPFGSDAA